MAKKFCTTGTCIPEKNYMVDLSNRIQQIINQYIESGQYFTINRARQYGKTTLLYLLEKELRKQDYLVLSLSFEAADEVDKSSDNQIFLSFLGLLREKYLKCQQGKDVTFHSVILAGVYDIKTLKLKLHPQEESKYNSLWNIADNNLIKVIEVRGQDELKNPVIGGRCINLDVHAIDVDGRHIDIEVQINADGSHVRRARYHSSMMDARMLQEGHEFKEIKDSYVIFIYDHDKFRKGLPFYHIQRRVDETGEVFGDGSHIIYVNGRYEGNDDIGWMMRDFHQCRPEQIKSETLSKAVAYYKEKEGRGAMSEAVRKYAMEYAKEYAKEYGEEQKQEGIQTGRRTEIYLSVQDGDYSVQRGAEKAGLSLEEFEKSMSEAGYKLPEPV